MKIIRTVIFTLVLLGALLLSVGVVWASVQWTGYEEYGQIVWEGEGDPSNIIVDCNGASHVIACNWNCYNGITGDFRDIGAFCGPKIWYFDPDDKVPPTDVIVLDFNVTPDTTGEWSHAYGWRSCPDGNGNVMRNGYWAGRAIPYTPDALWKPKFTWNSQCVAPFRVEWSWDPNSQTCGEYWEGGAGPICPE